MTRWGEYAVGLDLTLRDVQSAQKEKGLPWEIAKAFDTACPLSAFVAADQVGDPQRLQIKLTVNETVRQDGNTADMMRSVAELIAAASTYFTLEDGDILLTGTPSGVGRISRIMTGYAWSGLVTRSPKRSSPAPS